MKVLAAIFLAATVASAQTPAKRAMTFADLQAMKRVSDPQISPSGKWVLFSVTNVVLEKNSKTNHLWAVPLDGSAKEHQDTTGSGESNGRFSPDGKWVMYSSSEGGSAQIWIAPWSDESGKTGKGHAVTSLETEADGAIWAPDSRHIVFTSAVYPECESKLALGAEHDLAEAKCNADRDAAEARNPVKARVFDSLLYRHWNQFMGPRHSHIFYASVDSHDPPPTDITPGSVVGDHEAPTFTVGGPLGYAISPDGKEIAYSVNLDKVPAESTNNDIFTLAVGADPHAAKKVSTSPGSDDNPQYSPDGKWLAWRSQARNGYESDKFDLIVMDRANEKIQDLTSKFDGWVDEFAWGPHFPVTAADRPDRLYFTSSEAGAEPIFRVSLKGDEGVQRLTLSGEFAGLQTQSSVLISAVMTIDKPSEMVTIDLDEINRLTDNNSLPNGAYMVVSRQKQLTKLNEEISAGLNLGKLEQFWFPGANNTQVQGFLIKPPNFDPAKKYPVKFLIHGGPQGAWGDAWSYRWNPELFAADGYVVVMVNPRGSTGYGQKFLEQVSGDWGGRAYKDLMKGLDYAERHYPFIDKDRECALGASYGGFMADWILTHTNRFKCIVTHDGMYNPQSAFGTTEELWFNEWEFRPLNTGNREQGTGNSKSEELAAGGSRLTAGKQKSANTSTGDAVVEQTKPAHPWDFYDKPASEDPFRKWSPMLAIRNAHTPTLVVHGQRDYRLDVSEGFQLFTALQLLGVPSKMLYFPDEGHWVLKPKNSELWYQTVNDWCDRWTGMGKYATGRGTGNREQGTGKAAAKAGK